MKQKTFHAPLELKADGEPGEFRAIFATLNVVDHDKDLTMPGAFPVGQGVVIEPWNHDRALPVGRAIIQADEAKAWVEGQFLLDTTAGREHYETVRALGPLTEWSYTFWILDYSMEKRDGQQIRILKKLDVAGVSPVTRGAGLGTQTVAIKNASNGDSDTGDDDEGQTGNREPSGPPPRVIGTEIEIELMEV